MSLENENKIDYRDTLLLPKTDLPMRASLPEKEPSLLEKWNKEKLSINFFVEILNLLSQKIPTPPEYGLARDNFGEIISPFSLVEVDVNRESVIPSFGFSIDF